MTCEEIRLVKPTLELEKEALKYRQEHFDFDTDKIKPKARANFNGKLSLFLWCKVLFNLSEQTIYTPIVVKRSNLVREHPKTCQKNR